MRSDVIGLKLECSRSSCAASSTGDFERETALFRDREIDLVLVTIISTDEPDMSQLLSTHYRPDTLTWKGSISSASV